MKQLYSIYALSSFVSIAACLVAAGCGGVNVEEPFGDALESADAPSNPIVNRHAAISAVLTDDVKITKLAGRLDGAIVGHEINIQFACNGGPQFETLNYPHPDDNTRVLLKATVTSSWDIVLQDVLDEGRGEEGRGKARSLRSKVKEKVNDVLHARAGDLASTKDAIGSFNWAPPTAGTYVFTVVCVSELNGQSVLSLPPLMETLTIVAKAQTPRRAHGPFGEKLPIARITSPQVGETYPVGADITLTGTCETQNVKYPSLTLWTWTVMAQGQAPIVHSGRGNSAQSFNARFTIASPIVEARLSCVDSEKLTYFDEVTFSVGDGTAPATATSTDEKNPPPYESLQKQEQTE